MHDDAAESRRELDPQFVADRLLVERGVAPGELTIPVSAPDGGVCSELLPELGKRIAHGHRELRRRADHAFARVSGHYTKVGERNRRPRRGVGGAYNPGRVFVYAATARGDGDRFERGRCIGVLAATDCLEQCARELL